ncbi:MAG: hypothetical protein NC432_02030 [Roseburia sp.]|nr:hypothetical protein [Roseburia sp.]MCM1097409.1 hypothetical protein [Ruminococcus flavefaciens]
MNQAEIKRRQAHAAAGLLAFGILIGAAQLTGYNGITYVAAALEVCGLLFALASGGTAEALGKLLRIRNSKGQYRNAAGMSRNALLFQSALGVAGTAAALVFAGEIAEKVFRIQYSASILMILAPAIFLRSVSETLAGCCRGAGAELPGAIAVFLRQLLLLGFGLLFCRRLGDYGSKVSHLLAQENFASMYSGVGIAMAFTLSEFIVVLFLALLLARVRRSGEKNLQDGRRMTASFGDSIMTLWNSRGAQAGIQLLLLLALPLGLILFGRAAEDSDRMAADYGVYFAGYGGVCGILTGTVIFLLIPVCGKALQLMRREEHRFARTALQSGLHIGVVHAAFYAAFLAVMAEQVGAAFCGEQAVLAAKMLRGGSLIIVFAALGYYFSRIMLLTGKKALVLGAAALGTLLFAGFSAVFLNVGRAGVLSLVYGGLIGGGVSCIALGMVLCRQFRLRVDWLQTLAVPAGLACVVGFVGMLLGRVFTPHLGNPVTSLVCFVLMAALYWIGLLLLRNFREQELELIPGGKAINALGQMLGVL